MRLPRALLHCIVLAVLFAATPAMAASLQVSPTGLALAPAQNADVLTLTNDGSEAMRA